MNRDRKHVTVGVVLGTTIVTAGIIVLNAVAGPSPFAARTTHTTAATQVSALERRDSSAVPPAVLGRLRELHADGSFADARQVAPGLFIASYKGALCETDAGRGVDSCTDQISNEVWFVGEMIREWDSESAPFQLNLDGVAANGVTSLVVTTGDGSVHTVPVTNNAFSATLPNTQFADVRSVTVSHADGTETALDVAAYFPRRPKQP